MHAGLLFLWWCMHRRLVCRCTQAKRTEKSHPPRPSLRLIRSWSLCENIWVLSGRDSGRLTVCGSRDGSVVDVSQRAWLLSLCRHVAWASLKKIIAWNTLQTFSWEMARRGARVINRRAYLASVHVLLTRLLSDPERFLTPFSRCRQVRSRTPHASR